jgi:hypothetical protein
VTTLFRGWLPFQIFRFFVNAQSIEDLTQDILRSVPGEAKGLVAKPYSLAIG